MEGKGRMGKGQICVNATPEVKAAGLYRLDRLGIIDQPPLIGLAVSPVSPVKQANNGVSNVVCSMSFPEPTETGKYQAITELGSGLTGR